MSKKAKATSQCIKRIAISDLNIEPSDYQRPTNPQQVERIVERFDESKIGVLTVSSRNGINYVVDGAHRVCALRTLGYTHAFAEILTGLSYEQEASYFAKQNQDKRPLKPTDLFKAGLASGDERCHKINNIVRANGFQIGASNKNFYKIAAVNALYEIVECYSFETLDDTLCLIANTWNGISKASQSECLLGVAEFINRYSMVQFADRMHEKFAVVWYEYLEAVRCSVRGAKTGTNRRIFCRVLVSNYNKGLTSRSKKYLIWEE